MDQFYTVKIDNKLFHISKTTLNRFPESKITQLIFKKKYDPLMFYDPVARLIYIDRDPHSFKAILSMMRGYAPNTEHIHRSELEQKIKSDLVYYSINFPSQHYPQSYHPTRQTDIEQLHSDMNTNTQMNNKIMERLLSFENHNQVGGTVSQFSPKTNTQKVAEHDPIIKQLSSPLVQSNNTPNENDLSSIDDIGSIYNSELELLSDESNYSLNDDYHPYEQLDLSPPNSPSSISPFKTTSVLEKINVIDQNNPVKHDDPGSVQNIIRNIFSTYTQSEKQPKLELHHPSPNQNHTRSEMTDTYNILVGCNNRAESSDELLITSTEIMNWLNNQPEYMSSSDINSVYTRSDNLTDMTEEQKNYQYLIGTLMSNFNPNLNTCLKTESEYMSATIKSDTKHADGICPSAQYQPNRTSMRIFESSAKNNDETIEITEALCNSIHSPIPSNVNLSAQKQTKIKTKPIKRDSKKLNLVENSSIEQGEKSDDSSCSKNRSSHKLRSKYIKLE